MRIRDFVIAILDRFALLKCSRKVTLLSQDVGLYRTTRVYLSHGANKNNIELDFKSRIYGVLAAQYDGHIFIGKYSQLGPNSIIRAVNKVYIGDYTAIASNVVISDNNSHPVNPKDRLAMQKTPSGSKERSWIYSDNAPIIIGKNCWIGEISRICKGVTIGDGSIVAANAVVTKDVPQNCIAAGNPARVVKSEIDKSHQYFKSI